MSKRKNYYQVHKNKRPKAYYKLLDLTLDRRIEECYILLEQLKNKSCGNQ